MFIALGRIGSFLSLHILYISSSASAYILRKFFIFLGSLDKYSASKCTCNPHFSSALTSLLLSFGNSLILLQISAIFLHVVSVSVKIGETSSAPFSPTKLSSHFVAICQFLSVINFALSPAYNPFFV